MRDVEASSRWYQHLLGCQSAHGGPEYERLIWQGRLVLQLHRWDVEHHHGRIGDPNITPYGNGVLLWFELDDLYLLAMAVTPAKQRQGIGRRRMEEAKRIARAWPADAIRLDAYDAAGGAGPFYAGCGCTEVGWATYRTTQLIYYELRLA